MNVRQCRVCDMYAEGDTCLYCGGELQGPEPFEVALLNELVSIRLKYDEAGDD